MKKLILILSVLLCFSCVSSKKTTDKSVIDRKTDTETTFRKGEVITIEIPNIRYKDTVITKINHETKSIATVTYDRDGNQRFDCQTAEIRQIRELVDELIKNNIYTQEKNAFNPQYILYAIGFLGVLVVLLNFKR